MCHRDALAAPMVRQILTQPFVPGLIDLPDCAHLWILGFVVFHERNDSEVDAAKVWIGAKMITDHHRAFSFQLRKCAISFLRTNLAAPQRSVQLGHEAGFFVAAAQQINDRCASIFAFRSSFCFGNAIHLKLIERPSMLCRTLWKVSALVKYGEPTIAHEFSQPNVMLNLAHPCANL